MKSADHDVPGAFCSGHYAFLEFLQRVRVRKNMFFSRSPREKVKASHDPWKWLGNLDDLSFPQLTGVLFGSEVGSSPLKQDGGVSG